MNPVLKFPSAREIVDYLEQHLPMKDSCSKDKGMLQAIGRAFADKSSMKEGVFLQVIFALKDYKDRFNVVDPSLTRNIVQTLYACAHKDRSADDRLQKAKGGLSRL